MGEKKKGEQKNKRDWHSLTRGEPQNKRKVKQKNQILSKKRYYLRERCAAAGRGV